jgi:hypothetical protein
VRSRITEHPACVKILIGPGFSLVNAAGKWWFEGGVNQIMILASAMEADPEYATTGATSNVENILSALENVLSALTSFEQGPSSAYLNSTTFEEVRQAVLELRN